MRCQVLETQLVDLVLAALQRSEEEASNDNGVGGAVAGTPDSVNPIQLYWQHLSAQLIFFVLYQFASFPHIVNALIDKVRCGRCFFWCTCQFLLVCVCIML